MHTNIPYGKRRIKLLQVFSRYLHYGGEEGSVTRMGISLRNLYEVEGFIASSEEMLGEGIAGRVMLPFKAFHNRSVVERLRNAQREGNYDYWMIHNVFPAISPSAYSLAKELDVPIIHYLHNYRFGCANGFLFTKGEECRKCMHGNFIHGAIGKCWRDSFAQSSAMALLLARTRHLQGIFEQISQFIAISQVQRDIHVEMGVPEDRITVVPHYLSLAPDHAIPRFPPEGGHALFIGRLSPEKGVDRLLRAWALLPPDKKLVVAGDGPAMASLRSLASELDLRNVRFTGFLDNEAQREVWDNALFSVIPSVWQEPFGMVALEAWSKGRPVVAHAIGALPEIVTHGRDGFLAGTENPGQLAAALREAYERVDELPGMGEHGFQKLVKYYNESRWLEDISSVYEKAAARVAKTTLPSE